MRSKKSRALFFFSLWKRVGSKFFSWEPVKMVDATVFSLLKHSCLGCSLSLWYKHKSSNTVNQEISCRHISELSTLWEVLRLHLNQAGDVFLGPSLVRSHPLIFYASLTLLKWLSGHRLCLWSANSFQENALSGCAALFPVSSRIPFVYFLLS